MTPEAGRPRRGRGGSWPTTLAVGLALVLGARTPALAEAPAEPSPAVVFAVTYKLDLTGAVQGGGAQRVRRLDSLDLSADLNLAQAVGWTGASAHLDALETGGEAINPDVGSLQGVDNIEVGHRRLRLYQAWVEQNFANGRAGLRVGYSDVSGEFGVIDTGADLINPTFGFAPELAGAGPRGVAAYPSTALGARLRLAPRADAYLLAAAVDAATGSWGDPGGPDNRFDQGALLIAEAGWTGQGKLAIGAWTFTRRLDDLRPALSAAPRRVQGAYVLADQPVYDGGPDGRKVHAFVRMGFDAGDTEALAASWQLGAKLTPVFLGRPDSLLAVGASGARLSGGYRDIGRLAGLSLGSGETLVELSYADLVGRRLRVQPDLQLIRRPGGDAAAPAVLLATLRLTASF